VIKDPTSETLNKGEILVAERTDPGWIVHFALAAGLVTNFGSLLSHTAIVSRELGLPCVVAVSGATETICNGDYIEVDGSSGRVTILKRAVGDLLDAA
jgi:phosphoenolpyruvate synthase/pyruvate phosphate dikinase